MATLYADRAVAANINGLEIAVAANERFSVPDDLADEVQRVLQQRSDTPTITIEGYDRRNLFVGPVSPLMAASLQSVASANDAVFMGFMVVAQATVSVAKIRVGTQSGNVDAGIYDSAGTRLASSGTTACGSGNATQSLPLSAAVTLKPGILYYAAIACDNATATFLTGGGTVTPIEHNPPLNFRSTTSFPLPASVTPATATTRQYAVVFE